MTENLLEITDKQQELIDSIISGIESRSEPIRALIVRTFKRTDYKQYTLSYKGRAVCIVSLDGIKNGKQIFKLKNLD